MLELQDVLTRRDATAAETAGEETFVLDLETGEYFSLGSVGGFIWERLDGQRTLEEIAGDVVATFEVDLDQARLDVLDLAQQLLAAGLGEKGAIA